MERAVLLVLVMALSGAAGCGQAQTWKRIDADGKFTFQVPADLMQEDVQGVGAYIARYRGDDMLLTFHFNSPKTELCDATVQGKKPEFTSEAMSLSGRIAQIMQFQEPDAGVEPDLTHYAVVCFPDPTPAGMAIQQVTLVMWARCRNPQQQAVAKQIFQSIQFLRR